MSLVLKRSLPLVAASSGYYPAYKKARLAYSLARSYGPTAVRMGKRIFRAYKRYRGRKKRSFRATNFGDRPGTGTGKRHVTSEINALPLDTSTLYSYGITDIAQGDDINNRERRMVNLRGFKLCMELENDHTTPMYINIAVLCPRDGAAGVVNGDFFRGSSTARALDFDDAGITGMEYHCLPINSDRYTILKHKRYRLDPSSEAAYKNSNGTNFKNVDWYIPIKRQLRYNNQPTNDQPENGRCFLVYWFAPFQASAGAVAITGVVNVSQRVVAYFRDPKN